MNYSFESLMRLVPAEIQEYPEFISALQEVLAERDALSAGWEQERNVSDRLAAEVERMTKSEQATPIPYI